MRTALRVVVLCGVLTVVTDRAHGADASGAEDGERARAAAATALAEVDRLGEPRARVAALHRAIPLAERAVQLDEGNAEGHFLLFCAVGRLAEMQNPLRQAMALPRLRREIERTIQLDPQHAPGLAAKGEMLYRMPPFLGGDLAEAEAYLRRSLAADDTYWRAHVVLARVLVARERPAEAEAVLRALVARIDPQRDERGEALALLAELAARQH